MISPLVSIITPLYNAETFIEETILSVQHQTYQNWEMIIVDDCSYDQSLFIIEQYQQKDQRIILIKNQKNLGVASSRNRAIKRAKGKYIALLDADDLWLPQKLTQQVELMESKKVLMSYSSYHTITAQGDKIGYFSVKNQIAYQDLLKTSSIGTLTMIYNSDALGKPYFKDIGHEDYLYKLDLLKKIPFAYGIQEPLASYRIGNQSLSSNKLKASLWQWRIYRIEEKLSLLQSIYYFIHYSYHGIFKYKPPK
jgi:teichuronic acid biosynthesis glycosyltransferase TuaG